MTRRCGRPTPFSLCRKAEVSNLFSLPDPPASPLPSPTSPLLHSGSHLFSFVFFLLFLSALIRGALVSGWRFGGRCSSLPWLTASADSCSCSFLPASPPLKSTPPMVCIVPSSFRFPFFLFSFAFVACFDGLLFCDRLLIRSVRSRSAGRSAAAQRG